MTKLKKSFNYGLIFGITVKNLGLVWFGLVWVGWFEWVVLVSTSIIPKLLIFKLIIVLIFWCVFE